MPTRIHRYMLQMKFWYADIPPYVKGYRSMKTYHHIAKAIGKKRVWRKPFTTTHDAYTSAPVHRSHRNGATIPISTMRTPYPSSTHISSGRCFNSLATYCPPS